MTVALGLSLAIAPASAGASPASAGASPVVPKAGRPFSLPKGVQLVSGARALAEGHAAQCDIDSYYIPQHVAFKGVEAWLFPLPALWHKGQHCSLDKARLIMQTDGNFVVYDENNHPRWAADTQGRGEYAYLQPDSNLVVYDAYDNPVGTTSGTWGHTYPNDYLLAVQSDGNVVIYDQGLNWIWDTKTAH